MDEVPAPISCYGRSKLLGERAVAEGELGSSAIVRTSWVFGPGGRNFLRAILERARTCKPLAVVNDQIGRPTFTLDLAEALLDLAVEDELSGIYHAANSGHCSWHQFACDLLAAAGLGHIEVATMSSAELDRPAKRPAWSVLDCSRLTELRDQPLPHYRDAIPRYLEKEQH